MKGNHNNQAAKMFLPENLASQMNQQQLVAQFKIQLAKDIYTELVKFEYIQAKARAIEEAERTGSRFDEEGNENQLPFKLRFDLPAQVAEQAAIAFMVTQGMVRVEQPAQQ